MVDGGGEYLHAEQRRRAEVRQRIEEGQEAARQDAWPEHRQRDASEHTQGALAQRARGLFDGGVGRLQRRADEQEDVRIGEQAQRLADLEEATLTLLTSLNPNW